MKRMLILVLLCMFVISAAPLMAMDVSLGAATWYSWWDMKEDGGSGETPDIEPALLYGPLLSINFSDNWSLSSVFLYGAFTMNNTDGDETVKRFDSDTSMNYRLTNYLKLFGGVKITGYDFKGGNNNFIGPAAGLGVTVPVISNFFLLGNASVMYIYGKENSEDMSSGSKMTSLSHAPGFNSTISLAYYIGAASTTISLGGRYQFFKVYYDSGDVSSRDMTFYGATLSAVYSF